MATERPQEPAQREQWTKLSREPVTAADGAPFARFGIGPELVTAAGVFRVSDLKARGYGLSLRDHPAADLSGIVFPYFDPVSGQRVTARLRRDHPEVDSEGKLQNKYISPWGDNHHVYFPPGAASLLGDPTATVVFVEAEKSSLAITALMKRTGRQLLAVATGGCWSWRGKVGIRVTPSGGHEKEWGPLSDLSLITWEQDRPAIILFDSNTATNPTVRAARWAFAQYLAGVGAKVLFAEVPHEGGANGPDDLIAIGGDEALLALLDAPRPFPEQAEHDAQAAVAGLSNSCDLGTRDRALDAIAHVADLSHQRVLAERAAKALGERSKKAIERDITLKAKALREAREWAKDVVRQGQLLRIKIDPALLIDELEAFFRKRLALPDGATLIAALFTINTYVFEVFDTTPYIQIDSALGGCGKTTLLLHLEAVCCRAYLGCDPTPATLYRRIDRDRPTWLLDEASVIRGHEECARMIRAVLDAGYRKGATVPRCEGEDNVLHDFGVYCPKAFALVGSLRGTLLDRCIVLHLQKTPRLPKTKVKRLRREAPPLREKLEAYAAQYRDELQRLDDNEPDEGYWAQLDGREEELWGPLLFHARLAGEKVEKRALAVALSFSRQKGQLATDEDQTVALATELLEVLREMRVETFSPHELLSPLSSKESWGEKLADCKSDKARVCAVGRFLTNFRFRSRKRDSQGTHYSWAEALEVIVCHLPPTELPHATEPIKARVSRMASPENGLATIETRINTGPGANGKSNRGGSQGILKFPDCQPLPDTGKVGHCSAASDPGPNKGTDEGERQKPAAGPTERVLKF
jgi:hypothetical protein